MDTKSGPSVALNFEGSEPPPSIDLVPPGPSLRGRDGRAWTLRDADRVAAASMKRLSKLPIDINHSTDLAAPSGGASPAAGWITGLRAMGDGSLKADVQWNKRGEKALRGREYGYISPVLNVNGRGEVTEILRAALTNSPNLELPALNSESIFCTNDNTEEGMKKELCAALGIPEAATETEIVLAARSLRTEVLNAAQPATDATKAELNAMETRALNAEKQIAELCAARLKADAEAAVDGAIAARKIAPASRDGYLALCADEAGLARVKDILANSPEIAIAGTQAPDGSPDGSAALNAADAEFAGKAGYSEEEWAKIKAAEKAAKKEDRRDNQ